MNLGAAIQRLQAVRQTLTQPVAFYVEHYDKYRKLAETTALQVLVNLRPVDADPALWEGQARILAERVRAQLVDAETVGLVITMSEEKPASSDPKSPANYQLQGLSIGQVERWVEAGRNKTSEDEPGKNLDYRDEGKTSLQIAWRIMYAMKLNKPGAAGLEQHINRFLAAEQRGTAHSLLPQILVAWLNVFPPIAVADWRRWVHEVVSSA